MKSRALLSILIPLGFLITRATSDAGDAPIPLWPGQPPGDTKVRPPEADTTKPTDNLIAGRRLIRLGPVSEPTLTAYRPDPALNTGAAVIVCPGGGYTILALDLEGTEVCEWLNAKGITAFLLKYRVPRRSPRDDEKHVAALQDAQRALGIVRSRAAEFAIDPARIGILGFSAGGHLAAVASNNHETRTYPKIDDADDVNCRPDFAVLIYPAYLTDKARGDALSPEVPVAAGRTPPTFIAMTQDDSVRVETALFYYLALKRAGVPAELHLYPRGGHGYGLRRTENPVTGWPDRMEEWMRASGWLTPAG